MKKSKSQAMRIHPVEALVGLILGISFGMGFAYIAIKVAFLWDVEDRFPILVVIAMILVAFLTAGIKIYLLSQPVGPELSSTVLTMGVVMVVMVNGTPTLADDMRQWLKLGGLLFLVFLSAMMLMRVFAKPPAKRVG